MQSSDDEPREEKDHFVAQLYKFMDDSGTPLNKSPMIGTKDVDLYRLFRVVQKLGGYNRVTNQNKWRSVTIRLRLPNNQNTHNQVKSVYKKCLFSYESFYRTLGCTMLNHTRNAKKNRGRPLIREKDRATPVQSPKPDKEEEDKKEEEEKLKNKKDVKTKDDERKKKENVETSDTSSNSDVTEQSETPESSSGKEGSKPKKIDNKGKKMKQTDKVKSFERLEDQKKEENSDSDKPQQTRSKSQTKKDVSSPESKTQDLKTPPTKVVKGKKDEEKKRGRKRINPEEKVLNEIANEQPSTSSTTSPSVNIGDKLKVYYGPTHESKVTYEAKVIEIDCETMGPIYLVHYTGWNTRYDEWITPSRIAENLSATTKAKRLKQGPTAGKVCIC